MMQAHVRTRAIHACMHTYAEHACIQVYVCVNVESLLPERYGLFCPVLLALARV